MGVPHREGADGKDDQSAREVQGKPFDLQLNEAFHQKMLVNKWGSADVADGTEGMEQKQHLREHQDRNVLSTRNQRHEADEWQRTLNSATELVDQQTVYQKPVYCKCEDKQVDHR